MRSTAILAVALSLGLAAAPARASSPDLFGFGVRSPAMAGTGVAFADDFEAAYLNPAGLAAARRGRLTIGYSGATFRLTLDGQAASVEAASALFLGAELPLPLGGVMADRLALGLGLHLPTNLVNRALAPLPDVPTLLLTSRAQTVSVMAVLAARLPRGLALGGGLLALAALVGGVDLVGEAGGHIGATSEEQLVASYAPLVGASWEARPWLRLGAVYRGESLARYDIVVRSQLAGVLPFDLPTLRVAGVSAYDPHTVALEAALGRRRQGALLAVQLAWQHHAAMPPRVEPVTPGSPAPPPAGLRDTVNARLGFEWSHQGGVLRTTLRAGYAFVMSPVPDASPGRTLLDADRHLASAGIELSLDDPRAPLRLGGFYQLQLAQPSARAGGWLGAAGVSLGADL